jgi:hypothetical protein
MTGQCRFINYNKCTTLVGEADSRGGCTCVLVKSQETCNFLFNFAVSLEVLN